MDQPPAEVGIVPFDILRELSGLEFFRGLIDGRFPRPPIASLMDFSVAEAEEGRVVFEANPSLKHYNPLGGVHGGYAATLLDSCMGCAIHTRLAAGQGYTTLELKINYIRGMTDRTGLVRAEGKTIHVGGQTATSEGRLTDSQGRLLAHGTTTCLVFKQPAQRPA